MDQGEDDSSSGKLCRADDEDPYLEGPCVNQARISVTLT